MMPAEPRIRAGEQPAIERDQRVDLDDRPIGNLAERRLASRPSDEDGQKYDRGDADGCFVDRRQMKLSPAFR
jgi:hypothetical protein